MKQFLHITLISILLTLALATTLIGAEYSDTTAMCAEATPMGECTELSQSDGCDAELIFSCGRNTISAQRTANTRTSSRRNTIFKTPNSTALYGKSTGCCTVSSYVHNFEMYALATSDSNILIVRLHRLLI